MTEHTGGIPELDGTGCLCLEHMQATLPPSDRDNYPVELFARFAAHAAMLRATMPWCAALDEDVFLDYVACPRVNDEDISFHLDTFYAQLAPRVQGLEIEQAVLAINQWCNEQATYRQQDDRTASPWTVYTSGAGRCGEESAFAVAALRSVGIPARQVYAPRWSHCDDNHAWVEALCNGRWRFFGACESEPVLDKGWFNAAAGRAVLVHTRKFVPPGEPAAPQDGAPLDRRGPAQYYNQTARYTDVSMREVRVVQNGTPVADVVVWVELLNEAQFYPVLALRTGPDGTASVDLGQGDVHLRAEHPQGCAEKLFSAGEDTCTLDLQPNSAAAEGWHSFDFAAPVGTRNTPPLTDEQKRWRMGQLAEGARLREQRLEAVHAQSRACGQGEEAQKYLTAARGNYQEIATFLNGEDTPLRLALLGTLAEKDLLDTPAHVLEDHLQGAFPFAAQWPRELFEKAVLCPRIATEKLTPWRESLGNTFPGEEGQRMRQQPVLLWQHLCQSNVLEEYPSLYWAPDVALSTGHWDEKSRALLFVALLRSWGLPARLRPLDGAPTFWDGTVFVPPWEETAAVLTLQRPAGSLLAYRQNWSLARHTGGGWQTLTLEEDWQDDAMSLELPLGRYRLLTSVRLPNGNQYAARCDVELAGDMALPLQLREYCLADVLPSHTLPDFAAQTQAGETVRFPRDLAGAPSLLFWMAPGEEPTEHVLNELLEARDGMQGQEVRLFALLPDPQAAQQATFARVAQAYPEMTLLFGDWDDSLEICARSLFCDPDSPPLVVCCDSAGKAVYASSGYNVGLVDMLLQILQAL